MRITKEQMQYDLVAAGVEKRFSVALEGARRVTEEEPRRVAAAAIIHKGVLYTLPPPARHGHIIHHIVEQGLAAPGDPVYAGENQGFVDERGWFMGRQEAWFVALYAGQITATTKDRPYLFSEDVW